jgi:hypothetical protein
MKNSRKKKKAKFADKDLQDLKMLEEIKSGNVNAYEVIYNRYYRYIQYHCFMSVKDQQLANDLTVEILTNTRSSILLILGCGVLSRITS